MEGEPRGPVGVSERFQQGRPPRPHFCPRRHPAEGGAALVWPP